MKTVRFDKLEIGKTPRVVGVVATSKVPRGANFDLAEIRLDLIGPHETRWLAYSRILRKKGVPILLTIRSAKEGGKWKESDKARLALYLSLLKEASVVDIEIQSPIFRQVVRAAHKVGVKVVGSFHDFKRTPTSLNLASLIRRGRRGGADIVKIAAQIQKPSAIRRLFDLLERNRGGPLCLIGMGPLGRDTRVNLPLAGSCLAYGFIDQSAAPGQFSCRELRRRLGRAARSSADR